MKTFYTALFATMLSFYSRTGYSQMSIVSSNGYAVNVVILPRAIVTSTGSCTWGYNYNLRLDYNVTFTGNNIPGSLYTLQGTFGCGAATHFFSLPLSGGNGTLITQSNVWRSQNDCASATIASLECNTVQLTVDGPGIPNRTITYSIAAAPLPVKLTAFTATTVNQQVEISWSTMSENNNDYFSVERSADGNTWTLVKVVKGQAVAQGTANYQATDTDPLNGTSHYRLKQNDLDGKITYSEIRTVRIVKKEGISFYPVPNKGHTLYFKGISDPRQVQISIRNTAGTVVYQGQLAGMSLDLPVLKAGLYFISFRNQLTGTLQQEKYIQL